jgi:hypothetical protein
MSEHLIRLRAGWDCRAAGATAAEHRRLTLPVRWARDQADRLILSRKFGRPPFDQEREQVLLRMDQVSGIFNLTVNGEPMGPVSTQNQRYEIVLGNLRARNTLMIEIENPCSITEISASEREWGQIALVVRSIS